MFNEFWNLARLLKLSEIKPFITIPVLKRKFVTHYLVLTKNFKQLGMLPSWICRLWRVWDRISVPGLFQICQCLACLMRVMRRKFLSNSSPHFLWTWEVTVFLTLGINHAGYRRRQFFGKGLTENRMQVSVYW